MKAMAVEVVFHGAETPPEHLVWKTIAEAVLGNRSARVVARQTDRGWDVTIVDFTGGGFSTLAHPHLDGDFERELLQALRAAGIRLRDR